MNNGAAADFEIIGANFSYTFNQDGSKSLNLGVNANIPILTPWVYLEINMGLGFSMNSYSGSTLSTHGGLCVGYATACGGIENGGSLYWDRGGSFMGATVYAGVYASLGYGAARVSAGYEAGLFGMEGRGMYVGASAGGLYAQYAQNGGWNYGFTVHAYYGVTDDGNKMAADGEHREVSRLLWIPELGRYGKFKLGASCDVTKKGMQLKQKQEVLAMVESAGDDRFFRELKRDYEINKGQLSYETYIKLDAWMKERGIKQVYRPNWFHKEKKRTYVNNWYEYGNIEFMITPGKNPSTYSSYNYSNNIIDHLFLDVIGYGLSN